jgi:hypothetical protein
VPRKPRSSEHERGQHRIHLLEIGARQQQVEDGQRGTNTPTMAAMVNFA